jgi:glycosyltransferase involved in cell wall biosynthesis
MQFFSIIQQPLISVIVPCYNYGKYLATAIDSILLQSYKNHEIIVVDDGSTDNSKQVAEKYTEVKYIHQLNQGLSAARNTGIRNSIGEFLVFLDADDWLLPDALTINIKYLQANPEAAIVSGAYMFHYQPQNISWIVQQEINKDSYYHLLEGNYIGMPATVMYRKCIFNTNSFNPSLKYCEDYDLYLKITRKFKAIHHIEPIAAYRIHGHNMSGNNLIMLK